MCLSPLAVFPLLTGARGVYWFLCNVFQERELSHVCLVQWYELLSAAMCTKGACATLIRKWNLSRTQVKMSGQGEGRCVGVGLSVCPSFYFRWHCPLLLPTGLQPMPVHSQPAGLLDGGQNRPRTEAAPGVQSVLTCTMYRTVDKLDIQ